MPAKKTLQSLRVRGPLRLDGSILFRGKALLAHALYSALLTQSDADVVVAEVFNNTFAGGPVWSRFDVGKYHLTLAGAFPADKTVCLPSSSLLTDDGDGLTIIQFFCVDDSTLRLQCFDMSLNAKELQTSGPTRLLVEVRVYD